MILHVPDSQLMMLFMGWPRSGWYKEKKGKKSRKVIPRVGQGVDETKKKNKIKEN